MACEQHVDALVAAERPEEQHRRPGAVGVAAAVGSTEIGSGTTTTRSGSTANSASSRRRTDVVVHDERSRRGGTAPASSRRSTGAGTRDWCGTTSWTLETSGTLPREAARGRTRR